MQKLIWAVAKGLGWNPSPYGTTSALQIGGGPGPEIVWPNNPIVFAAYAKAEMAKHHWFVEPRPDNIDHWMVAERDHDGYAYSGQYKYDPTDPISEAEAVLRCVADVLHSNAQDQRRV